MIYYMMLQHPVHLAPVTFGHTIMEFYSETHIIPAITGNDRSYLWESYLIGEPFPIPEVNDPTNALSSFRRALAFGLRTGNSIEVTQKIEVEIGVDNPAKIDVDYRYYSPKNYCGTWQQFTGDSIISNGGGYFDNAMGRNALVNRFHLTVLSEFVPSEYLQFQSQYRADLIPCNWRLQPDVFPDQGTGVPVAGFSLVTGTPESPSALLNIDSRFLWLNQDDNYPHSSIGITGAYRENLNLDNLWYKIGMYFYEGCYGISVRNSLSIDSIEQIVIPATIENSVALLPECSSLGSNCSAQFDLYLQSSSGVFLSQQACVNSGAVVCLPTTWVCPSDPSYTREVWNSLDQ